MAVEFVAVGPHMINVEKISRFYVDQFDRAIPRALHSTVGAETEKVLRVSIYFLLQTADQCLVLTDALAAEWLAIFQAKPEGEPS